MSEDEATPARRSFRLKTSAVIGTLVGGAVLCAIAVWLHGRTPSFVGGLVFGAGLATLAMTYVRWRYRLVLGPEGISVPRRPTIPWHQVMGCQLHMLRGIGGFEIEATGPQGNTQHVFVSRRLEGYAEALGLAFELAARYEAPWALSESFEAIRAAGRQAET